MAYKVVVVEDEPQVAELLRLILRHPEIEVFLAFDGESGLETIRQVRPDLVILDIMMPNMNGWEVYDTMRSEATLKHIPVIIETVLPERPERKQTFALSDIDYYFTKPFDTIRLRREVGRMLGKEQLWPPPKTRPLRPLPDSASAAKSPPEPEKIDPPAPDEPPPAEPTRPPGQPVSAAEPTRPPGQPVSAAAKSPPEPEKIDPPAPDEPPPAEPTRPPGQPVSAAEPTRPPEPEKIDPPAPDEPPPAEPTRPPGQPVSAAEPTRPPEPEKIDPPPGEVNLNQTAQNP
jgi:two-component system response regulator VicR